MSLVGLADHPALELLNTVAEPAPGRTVEFIATGPDYLSWLAEAALVDGNDLDAIRNAFSAADFEAAAVAARDLREALRGAVASWSSGTPGKSLTRAIERLNAIMAVDDRFSQLHADERNATLHDHRRWHDPAQLLIPPALAWANLLVEGDRSLVRRCEGCTIWFYDRTKAHRRRWCSMALCGNREKARRHRSRPSIA